MVTWTVNGELELGFSMVRLQSLILFQETVSGEDGHSMEGNAYACHNYDRSGCCSCKLGLLGISRNLGTERFRSWEGFLEEETLVFPLIVLVLPLPYLNPAGLGHSREAAAPAPVGELVPGSFLMAVVDALELGPPVVISPSLSGMYSLPFLTAPGSQLRGYVPVAPICTDKITAADYANVKVPLCGKLRQLCQEPGRVHP